MLGLILMAAKLVHTARLQGWQHIHVHSCADAANVALFAKWLGGIKYSLTLHNPLAVYGGNQRQKWRHATFGIVITHAILDDVRRTLQGNLPPQIEVAPMGVDASVFSRTSPYLPYEGHGALRVFCCARLNPCKGHRFLVEAIDLLRREGMSILLEIAGEDDVGGFGYRCELEALIRSRGLEGHVSLLGAVSEEVVRERLTRAHVFVLASLAEPLGVAIMEAMSMEVPVVATRAGGVPELISDGQDGILVPPSDPVSIARALRAIATNPGTAESLGESARRKVVDKYSVDGSAKAIGRLVFASA
jgi:glycosyltransferase involved in cell wall biosynthesis